MKNILYILLTCLTCWSCVKSTEVKNTGIILSTASGNAVTPLTGFDADGQPYIWWIEKPEDSEKNIVVFASSKNMGDSFEESVPIPVTSGCNDGHGQGMPKLIFKKDGTMIIVYHMKQETEENPYAGKIYYSQSYDKGKTWDSPSILHQDTLKDNGHGFPALTLLPDGEVAAVWLDGRNNLPHSELFMARTDGKSGFSQETKIGGPACQCCKIDFYSDKDNIIHVLYRGILEDNIRDIMHISSSDSGNTFSEAGRISKDDWKLKGCPHAGPGMVLHKDSLHYVWFTMGGGEGIFYCRSDKSGNNFSNRVNLAKGISKYPQITSLPNKQLAIAWQEFDTISVKDKSYSRVKLQLVGSNETKNSYVTSEGIESFHPALLPLGQNHLLLAYELKFNDRSVVSYKKIKVSE